MISNKEKTLIGVFINRNKLLSLLEALKFKYKQNIDRVFIYQINLNTNEYLVTFTVLNKEVYLKSIPNSTVLHVKNGCLFSINALNKLIERDNGSASKDYVVNWEKYRNNLIVLTNGELSIHQILKIDDKCQVVFS